MPIDPSIYGQQQQFKVNTPFEVLGQLGQLRAQQQESALRQQQMASAQAEEQLRRQKLAKDQQDEVEKGIVAKILSDPKITKEQADALIAQQAPGHIESYRKTVQEHEKAAGQIAKDLADGASAMSSAQEKAQTFAANDAQRILKMPEAVRPGAASLALQTYEEMFPHAKSHFEQMRQQLASGADATTLLQGIAGASTQQRNADIAATTAAAELPGKVATSQIQQQVAGGMQGGLTPDQQRQAAQARTTAAEAARHNRTDEALAGGRLGVERTRLANELDPLGMAGQGGAAVPAATGQQAPAGPIATAGQPPSGYNEAALSKLAPPIAAQVKAIVEGRRSVDARTVSTPFGRALLNAAYAYDPSFDQTNYNARYKARADLTSPNGQGGKTINALNTAIQHAGKLSDLIEALDNGDYSSANAVANWWNKQTGGTKVTNFEAVQPQLMKEIERAWRGTGGSSGDIQALEKSLGPNMGRQAQREALLQFVDLMKGKLETTEQQRDNALGPVGQSVPILFEQSKPILSKIEERAGKAPATAQATPGTIRARDPQGKLHEAKAGTPLPAGWKLEP